MTLLFDPAAHEPLAGGSWDKGRARTAIAEIAGDAQRAFDDDGLWPGHERDELPPSADPIAGLYLGAAGVVWALDRLGRAGAVESRRDWAGVAATLPDRYVAAPDLVEETGGPVPSLWVGEAGILLIACLLAPNAAFEERLLACVRSNAANPTLEFMWGAPGTMLAAQVMHERTGDERWATAWRESADRLWARWDGELWEQDLYGRRGHIVGPAHGFAGNVFVLGRGSLLDDERRAELERRAVAAISRLAQREDGVAQWPSALEPPPPPRGGVRTQWCHGAPGIVAALAWLAPRDERFGALLDAGGELTWRAGPLAKGAGLCHGTAGNGYALLKLFERTGDERWLERARAFAMHAIVQVEREREAFGRGRYTLWTGDLGAALFLWGCVTADAAMPTLDAW